MRGQTGGQIEMKCGISKEIDMINFLIKIESIVQFVQGNTLLYLLQESSLID